MLLAPFHLPQKISSYPMAEASHVYSRNDYQFHVRPRPGLYVPVPGFGFCKRCHCKAPDQKIAPHHIMTT